MTARSIHFSPARGSGARVSEPDDAALLDSIGKGEMNALAALYDRHQNSIRRFLLRATGGADDVDDLLHETLLTAARIATRYDGRPDCRPWLIGIAVRLLRRRQSALGRWWGILARVSRSDVSVSHPAAALEARSQIDAALQRLSLAKRTTLLLFEVEGLTSKEVAEALGIPVGTVWTRLHAARHELRALLEGELS